MPHLSWTYVFPLMGAAVGGRDGVLHLAVPVKKPAALLRAELAWSSRARGAPWSLPARR